MMTTTRLFTLLTFLLAPTLSGCFLFASDDDDDGGGFETQEVSDPSVSYPTDKAGFLRTLEIDPLAPTVSDVGTDVEFRIDPALPEGLAFDETTGEVSGTPTVVAPATEYTVRVVNVVQMGADEDGNPIFVDFTVAETTLCIQVFEAEGPTAVSYPFNPASYDAGIAIAPNVPTVDGVATAFASDVPLPDGLALSPTTGVITGTPQQETPLLDIVVTASNPFGSVQTTLQVRVLGQADASAVLVLNLDGTFSNVRRRPARRFSHRTFRATPDQPVSSAASPSGRFLFVSCADGSLVRYEHDAGSARPDRGTLVGQYPVATEMLMDSAGERLVMLGSGELRSIRILADGSVGAEEVLAVSDQSFAMDRNPTNDQIYLLASGAGQVSTYELRPALAPAGPGVATPGYPGHVEVTRDGRSVYVSNVTGGTVVAFAATPGGAAPLEQRQEVAVPGFIADLQAADGHLYVARSGAASGLLRFDIEADSRLADGREYAPGADYDSLAAPTNERTLYALDAAARELVVFDLFGSSTVLDYRLRTRDGAFELGMLPGPQVFSRTRWTLAADPAARTLSALEIEYGPGSLTAAAAGSVPTGADPAAVVMDEAETAAWVANRGGGSLARYAFEAATGQLSLQGEVPSAGGPLALALDPSERFLFALNGDAPSIQRFDVGEGSELTAGANTPLAVGEPVALGFEPTGQFLYVLASAGTVLVFEMDPASGQLGPQLVVETPGELLDLAFALEGRYLYVSSGMDEILQFAIDAQSGALAALTPPAVPTGLDPVSLAAHGRVSVVVAACAGSDEVRAYRYDPETGLLAEDTNKGPLFAYNRPVEVLFDFDETYLYVANDDAGLPALRTWCWVCNGIPSEESAFDAGGRLPVLFAGSGMGD